MNGDDHNERGEISSKKISLAVKMDDIFDDKEIEGIELKHSYLVSIYGKAGPIYFRS